MPKRQRLEQGIYGFRDFSSVATVAFSQQSYRRQKKWRIIKIRQMKKGEISYGVSKS